MKNIILLFKTNQKRNFISLIIALAFSVVLCFAFVLMGNNFADYDTKEVTVGFLDEDQSSISIDFKGYLEEGLKFHIVTDDYDSLANQLIERKISAIIEIPSGLEADGLKQGELPNVITTTLDDYENVGFIKSYINVYFNSINLLMKTSEGSESQFQKLFFEFKNQKIEIKESVGYISDRQRDAVKAGLPQAVGFFTMMMMIMSLFTSTLVMEDRKSGVFKRMQASPVKSSQYLIGTSAFAILVSLLIVIVFCVFLYATDYPIGKEIPYLALGMSLFVVFMVGVSLIAALFTKSENAMKTLLIIVGTVGPIMGGAYFPVGSAPELLQRLSKLTPHYWLMQGIKDLLEKPDENVWMNLVILALFALLSFLIAGIKFVQKEEGKEY